MHRQRFVVLAHAIVLGLALSQVASAQKTAPVRQQLAQLNVSVPDAVGRSVEVGQPSANAVIHLAVSLPYGDAEGMQSYVDDVSNPKSKNYRHWLTPEQVGERYGLPLAQLQTVKDYLSSNGMNVTLVGKNRLSILVDSTVAQAENAFHVSLKNFHAVNKEAGNQDFFSYTSAPQVPTNVAPYILDVSGLQSFTKPQYRALTPAQTKVLYNLAPLSNSSLRGEGRTVAISNFDGYRLTNVPLYYSHFGLPTPAGGAGSNVTEVKISGGAGTGAVGAEGDLDIQMVLGMAPLCNFIIYDGGASDLIGTLTREVNDNSADIISESYGWSLPAATATSAHNLHLSMSAQGITYMAASGDSGTTIEPYSYPNYDPEVLIVGGTVATTDASGNRTGETGWSGSGGGWSTNTATFNVRPSWQVGNGVPTNVNHRLGPDIALHAASSTGAYQFYLNGSLTSAYTGTSFACPVFAGGLAVVEQQIINNGALPADVNGKRRFGRIQDLIYSQNGRSDVWLDITTGSTGRLPDNTSAVGKVGWDYVTGWGVMNFANFAGTQGPAVIPNAPTGVTATAGSGQITVSWSSSLGATSYSVKRSNTAGGPYTSVGTSTGTSFTNTGLTNGTTYYYVVSAINTAGESGNSSEVSATPVLAVPNFTISTSPSSLTVRRNKSGNYTVTVGSVNGFTGNVALSVSGVPANTTATFTPSSINGSGTSTLKIATTVNTARATYTLTVTGTSGTTTHSSTVTLTVN